MAQQTIVPAREIEVKTEPLQITIGTAPLAVQPRPDLAGLRLKAPNAAAIYLVDPDGFLRWIPNAQTYNNLFRDWNGVVASTDIPNIARGLDLSAGAVLVRAEATAPIFLVSNGIKRWITSSQAMDKYYFKWDMVLVIPHILVDFISTGASWS